MVILDCILKSRSMSVIKSFSLPTKLDISYSAEISEKIVENHIITSKNPFIYIHLSYRGKIRIHYV